MYIPSVLKGHCQVKDLIIFVTNNSFALKWKTTKSCLASSLWLSGQPSAHVVPALTQHSTPCTGCLRLLFFFFLFFSSLFFNRFHQNQILSRSSDFSNKQLFVFPDNWVRLCTWRCPFKIFFFLKKKKKSSFIHSVSFSWAAHSIRRGEILIPKTFTVSDPRAERRNQPTAPRHRRSASSRRACCSSPFFRYCHFAAFPISSRSLTVLFLSSAPSLPVDTLDCQFYIQRC